MCGVHSSEKVSRPIQNTKDVSPQSVELVSSTVKARQKEKEANFMAPQSRRRQQNCDRLKPKAHHEILGGSTSHDLASE